MEKSNRLIMAVAPAIIPQPTWGGSYILQAKKWQDRPEFTNLKIGQSYELFSGSWLMPSISSTGDPRFTGTIASSDHPNAMPDGADVDLFLSLKDYLIANPGALGRRPAERHGGEMRVLIKFTQAKGNSFQVHPRPQDETDEWKAKPESWLFLEDGGRITCGAKPNINWERFEVDCRMIESGMNQISELLSNCRINDLTAQASIKDLLKEHDPWQYVNIINARKGLILDLSSGGTHHSWEEGDGINNIVYEVQSDVQDSLSTLRCFDKGKIRHDGMPRPVQISDYFHFVDRSLAANQPENLIKQAEKVCEDETVKVESIFRTPHYCLDRLTVQQEYAGEQVKTNSSFHHLFMNRGSARIIGKCEELLLTRGHSGFVSAEQGQYRIIPEGECEILKTYV